ncbi:SusC/RagA family TonB-linked outer membrane protein [Pontibacter akesuensis]|uniref:TonB-linked outer membrane protein, SusC/RagA family n=1 Tax=Pontibacter akesuensis TaxID=388950 RepID=A0A1I7GT30_9BACT|nr:TonB-dependent receptor [Pontibacter akesuensis]GHA55210.1 SusC/RagA family TonB-linked outer membrane protein [Pontibacter akesuensis]SFU51613.1 TonB-linked outer membrane protein, SusC/RagA family [Pontibacter akesuensis]
MKKLLLILLLHITGIAYAQNTITGRVTTAGEGIPLPGVSVVVTGTSIGTTTDAQGAYSLTAPASASTLSFSFIGFVKQEVPIGNQATINVQLAEDTKALQEVVVVGYGTQLRREVTTAISSVKPEEITQTPVQRVEQALQGRVAGVQVTNISGQPGDAPTVRIRGIGTSGSAAPLYIVDGFPVGGIDYLNPADIESMEVLKDAASAAIYGARGANGVVLITTRSGSRDGKMHVSYDGYVGFQNPWRRMELLNAREYAVMMNEGAANAGNALPYPDVTQFGEGTDWQEALFEKNAPIMNHQISVNGGTDKNAYAAAFSLFDQNGIVGGDKSNFKRYTARINSDNKVKEYLRVGTNLAYSHIDRRAIDPNQEFGGLLSNAINLDPLTPIIVSDPNLLNMSPYNNPNVVRDANGNPYGISSAVAQEIVNPLARLAVLNGRTRVDKLVGNLYGEVDITEGLSFRSTFGLDLAFVSTNNFNPLYYLNRSTANNNSLVSKGVDRYYNWQAENYFKYNKTFGEHDLGLTAGTSALRFNYESLFASNTGLVSNDPNLAYLNTAVDRGAAIANGAFNERALLSFYGRATYGYKGKYLFSASIRRDGSSRFGSNNPYATFPSVSAGWVISDEDFFPESDLLNFVKLRASWGQNGNEEIGGAYPWASTIGVGRGYSFYNPGGVGYQSGAAPEYIANPDLKWEASEQTDIGLDLALFNNNLRVTADYYIKRTKGLLLYAPIPATPGNNPPLVNGGEVENKGFELAINYSNEINDFGYAVGLNGSINKNEFLSINNAEGVLQGASISTYGTVSRSEVGQPIAYFWGYQTNGIFQTPEAVAAHVNSEGALLQPAAQPGDVRFVDFNNDGIINDQDRTRIGNPTPKAVLGFTLDLNYKGFDINAFVNGAFGHQIFNGTRRHDLSTSNMQSIYLNRWTGEGSTNEYPRFTWNDANGNYKRISDLYIEDGDYVRLKTLQLGYNFAPAMLETLHLQKVRLYIAADNLVTLTDYTGFDPEIGARGSLDIGIDRGIYPQARTFRLGVNATF